MSYLSIEWLAWLVGTVSLYWLFPSRYRDIVLVAVTAAFLAVYSYMSLIFLVILTVFTFFGTRVSEVSDRRVLSVSAIILIILAFFKIRVYEGSTGVLSDVVIPLGLSYYSFRCFHYVFERYRDTLAPHGFREYVCYLFFLPTLVVGPIHRAQPFFDDLRNKRWSADDISYGLERILYGYAKIAVLSGFLVNRLLTGWQASLPPESALFALYLEVVIDGLDLYFLFAGYSDIAIGFARLLGFKVIENFNWPFLRKNISEFWRCWHISLSSWCRDYVYFPVVGLTRNPYLATLATFAVIGLWHEISARYILWGLWHGLGIMAWRRFQYVKRALGLPAITNPVLRVGVDALSVIATAHYVWFGLVIVSQGSLAESLDVYYLLLVSWWL